MLLLLFLLLMMMVVVAAVAPVQYAGKINNPQRNERLEKTQDAKQTEHITTTIPQYGAILRTYASLMCKPDNLLVSTPKKDTWKGENIDHVILLLNMYIYLLKHQD